MSGVQTRPRIVIHDTDLHGLTCGIAALYAMPDASAYSHFDPQSPMRTTPDNLANVVMSLGAADLWILDIPIDIRNPKAVIDALVSHQQYKGRVYFLDHHGHSQWTAELARQGVGVAIFGSSYDLTLAVPRIFNRSDRFVEDWALLGAVADFDTSIASRVSRDFEETVCDIIDSVYKLMRPQLLSRLGITENPSLGNIGSLSWGIVQRRIDIYQFIEVCRELGKPLEVPQYSTVGNVVFTTQVPPPGLSWKVAWKLCLITGAKVALVPAFVPMRNQYTVIVATYWREGDAVRQAVENFVTSTFIGRQIVGHIGARSILLFSESEIQNIPMWARQLDEMISQQIYTPRVTRLINDELVARSLAEDFRAILARLTQILEEQRKMYQEYLELKRQQVELLRQTTQPARRAD